MTDVAREIQVIDGFAERLDELSKAQTQVLEDLAPIESRYERELAAFERDLWKQHLVTAKAFPSERIRSALFNAELDKDFYESYVYLKSKAKRLDKQVSSIKTQIDARRSILSALKLELEATT